jgi:hypothetical protein
MWLACLADQDAGSGYSVLLLMALCGGGGGAAAAAG